MHQQRHKRYEDYAYVLDLFRPHERGRYSPKIHLTKTELVTQLVGDEYFTLMEAAVHEKAGISVGDRVYIGKDMGRDVTRIIGRISYEELTENAKLVLEDVVQKIVASNEDRFVRFFNSSQMVSLRVHGLELVPGIGKKMVQKIVEERQKEPFRNYEDIKTRIGLPDPVKSISRRILDELSNPNERYFLFVREPVHEAGLIRRT